jgi:hypothetical protein
VADRLVSLGSLAEGAHFTFAGSQDGVYVERLPGGCKVMIREKQNGKSWRYVEHLWSASMKVTPAVRVGKMPPIRVGSRG